MRAGSSPAEVVPRRLLAALLLALVVLGALRAYPARALPLFSRSTGLRCTDCHDGVPRLGARGLAFLQSGYQVSVTHVRTRRTPFPISMVANLRYGVTMRDTLAASVPDHDPPLAHRPRESSIELHSAGRARERWSWHLDQRIGADGGALETRTASFQLDDLVGTGALQLRAGRFEAGLPFLAASRRPTLAPYRTPVSLDAEGLELNGARAQWCYAAGVTEDQRTRPRGTPGFRYLSRLQDTYLWVSRTVAGQRIGGRLWFDRQDSDLPFHTWLQHMQHEVAACLTAGRVQVTPAYLLDRFDDRPAAELHDKHHMALLEVVTPLGRERRWWVCGRYEHEYRTRTPFSAELDRQSATLDLSFDARPDTRVALEWSHGADNIGGPRVDALDAYVRVGY